MWATNTDPLVLRQPCVCVVMCVVHWVVQRASEKNKLSMNQEFVHEGILGTKFTGKLIRKEIYTDILENGWNKKLSAFTQSYGSDSLDASLLLMESFDFIKSNNLKYVKTVKAIEKDLMNDGLLFRYKNEDDFGFPSSSFTVCSFWYINSLYKIGEKQKSKKYFEKILKYSNHLGLYSEDLDFKSKRLLGNFPQAYSHLALIDCALNFNSE